MHWITPSPNTARTAEISSSSKFTPFRNLPITFPTFQHLPTLLDPKEGNQPRSWMKAEKSPHQTITCSVLTYNIYILFSASLLTEFAGERSSWMFDAFLVQVGKLHMIHPETMNAPPWTSCLNKDAHRFTCKMWKFVGEILRSRRFTAAPDLPEEAVGFRLRGGKQPIWAVHESLKSKQVKWVFCRKK